MLITYETNVFYLVITIDLMLMSVLVCCIKIRNELKKIRVFKSKGKNNY